VGRCIVSEQPRPLLSEYRGNEQEVTLQNIVEWNLDFPKKKVNKKGVDPLVYQVTE
jgi:hypothetical protein